MYRISNKQIDFQPHSLCLSLHFLSLSLSLSLSSSLSETVLLNAENDSFSDRSTSSEMWLGRSPASRS